MKKRNKIIIAFVVGFVFVGVIGSLAENEELMAGGFMLGLTSLLFWTKV